MRAAPHRLVAGVNGSKAGRKGFVSSIVGALAFTGCFSPVLGIDDCDVTCSTQTECPPGFECAGGYCVAPGSVRECRPPEVVLSPNDPPPLAPDPSPPEKSTSRPPEIPKPPPEGGVPPEGSDGNVPPPPNDACSEATGVAIAPCVLRQPCRDLPYAVTFTPSSDGLVWSAAKLPPGLELDAATLTVAGVVHDSGSLVLEGKNASGVVVQRAAFELEARSSCSVAFMVDEGSGARLHLADREGLPSVPEIILPATSVDGERVVDFAFSPAGRSLLVRSADADGQNRLALYSAPDWRERALPALGGSVLEYSWSLDGSAVAAVLQSDAGTLLGGFRFPSVAGDATEAITALEPVATPGDTRPAWFTEHHVGFLSAEGEFEGSKRLHSAALGASGFTAPIEDVGGQFSEDADTLLRLESNERGLLLYASFLNNPTLVELYRPVADGLHAVTQRSPAIPSPDVSYSALVQQGVLRVQRSYEEPLPTFASLIATAGGCNALLGWSPASDRLLCVSDGVDGGNLRLFDFDGEALSQARPVEGSYVYTEAQARLRRRAFSPSGRWLVFANDFVLYTADLAGPRLLQLARSISIDASLFPELAFSPDDRYLTRHQGDRVFIGLLGEDRAELRLNDRLPASLPCDEHLARSSHSYCGNTSSASSQVSWASDSRSFLFANDAGELQLMRVLPLIDGQSIHVDRAELRAGCGQGCLGRFALQP